MAPTAAKVEVARRSGWAVRLAEAPWFWIFAAALAVWLGTLVASGGQGASAIVTATLSFAVFYAVVGIGQMVVIAAGPGNIDLSIPATMTLAAYLGMGTMAGKDAGLWAGLAIALGVGIAVGAANIALILLLRVPPIIATLASGFVVQSAAIAYSRGSTAKPAPMLSDLVNAKIATLPVVTVALALLSIGVAVVLRRSTFGRSVLAIGQNRRAAALAGIDVPTTLVGVYVISGVLAALAGVLLAAYSGGAALNMAGDFLLASIAVVVLGGTRISGGQATVAGVWGASLFLYLLTVLLNTLQVGAGPRFVLTGIVIIAALSVASGRRGSGRSGDRL
jgi:ribose transport system permease protein